MVVIGLLGTSEYNIPSFLQDYYRFELTKLDNGDMEHQLDYNGDMEHQLDYIASMIEKGCHKIVVSNVSNLKQVRALRFFFSSIIFQIGSPQDINRKIKPDYIIHDIESEYKTFSNMLEAMNEIM